MRRTQLWLPFLKVRPHACSSATSAGRHKKGETVKRGIPYIAMLSAGLCLVLWACPKKAENTEEARIEADFQEMVTESAFHKQVVKFQHALDEPNRKDPEKLSKQLEAQLHIKELIIKSREAQQAKYLPFFSIISNVVGGILAGLATIIVTLLAKRNEPAKSQVEDEKKRPKQEGDE